MKKINYLFLIFFIFSCSSLEDAGKVLRNEKINTTDEFLIKKQEPLVLPPDYNEIPKPGSLSEKKSKNRIKKILKSNDKKTINNNNASSLEDSIINKIKK